MINYKITLVDTFQMIAQFVYSSEGKEDYYTQVALGLGFTEEQLHALAKEHAHEASFHWKRLEDAVDFTLGVDSGSIKNMIVTNLPPEFDVDTQILKVVDTEDENAFYRTYVVEDMSAMEKGMLIRNKRDSMLQGTDAEALPDRNPSVELLAYRQALRDIPQQATYPDSVIWPIKPI